MPINLAEIISGDDIKYFKQFNVYQTLNFSHKRVELNKIIGTGSKINIVSAKFIDTFQGTSIEGQSLTGKKLIILGFLTMKLLIPYCDCDTNVYVENMKMPFSTFIIVPEEICENQPVKLRYLIEDVTIKAITSCKVLISATVLLQFIDEYIL